MTPKFYSSFYSQISITVSDTSPPTNLTWASLASSPCSSLPADLQQFSGKTCLYDQLMVIPPNFLTSLNPFLPPGCTVAIDAYCWLHSGAFGCAEQLVCRYIKYVMKYVRKYINLLLQFNIKVVLVLMEGTCLVRWG